MGDPLSDLLAALDLGDSGARTTEDIFTAPSLRTAHGRVFGGQVLAQSVVAAQRTVEEGRVLHSMHGYFLRPGDDTQGITFSVDRIHDGRSFSTRRAQAYQDGLPILSMISSFETHSPGLDHQEDIDVGSFPDPDALPTAAELAASAPDGRAKEWVVRRPFDIRYVDRPIYLQPDPDQRPSQAVWMRAVRALPDDPALHQAALAFASDYTILESTLRRHGLIWNRPDLRIASLDHAMWWHRPARADDWILYVQHAPSASGGRGLSQGRMYDRTGRLVASVAQEGMIRVPAAPAG